MKFISYIISDEVTMRTRQNIEIDPQLYKEARQACSETDLKWSAWVARAFESAVARHKVLYKTRESRGKK